VNEQKVRVVEANSICACHAGPMPSLNVEMDNIPDLVIDPDDEEDEWDTEETLYVGDDQLKEGDRLFTTMIPCEVESIWATLNISQ
jgi:hypothetical protein